MIPVFGSAFVATSLYVLFLQIPAIISKSRLLIAGIIFLFLLPQSFFVVRRVVYPWAKAVGVKKTLLTIGLGLLAGSFLGYLLAIAPQRDHYFLSLLPKHTLSIVALPDVNPASSGNEVEIWGINTGFGFESYNNLVGAQDWTRRENELLAPQTRPSKLIWQGKAVRQLQLTLKMHPAAGKLRVEWDGTPQVFDLYAETEREQTLYFDAGSSTLSELALWGCVSLGFLAFLLPLWIFISGSFRSFNPQLYRKKISFKNLSVFLCLSGLFLLVRSIGLAHSTLWWDDIETIGSLAPLAADKFMPAVADVVETITGPVFPTLILKAIANFIKPDELLLKLSTLFASLAAFLVFYFIIKKQVGKPGLVAVFLWCLSVPLIIHSQGFQPSIYYALATCLLAACFLKGFHSLRNNPTPPGAYEVMAFARPYLFCALMAFLCNYMSLLVFAFLLMIFSIEYFLIARKNRKTWSEISFSAYLVLCEVLPLALAAYWRVAKGGGDVIRFNLGDFYAGNGFEFVRLLWDTLTYTFNFGFTRAVYWPGAFNPLAIPFVLLFLAGIVYLCLKQKRYILYALLAPIVLFGASWIKILPLGGIRHTLTFAPVLFILVGYGMRAILEYLGTKTGALIGVTLCLLAGGIFLSSGTNLYRVRQSALEPAIIQKLALENKAATLVTYPEYEIEYLRLKGIPWDNKVQLSLLTHEALACPCLLITTGWSMPGVTGLAPDRYLPFSDPVLDGYRITPLYENPGNPLFDAKGYSIYSPANGLFIYLMSNKTSAGGF